MTESVHVILVQERRPNMAPRFDCLPSCEGTEPHVHSFRSLDVRPTVKQTAAFKALDAKGPAGD